MKSAVLVHFFALAAVAGAIAVSLPSAEEAYETLEIRSEGAVLAVVDPLEEGGFPETVDINEAYIVVPEACIGCRLCVSACPVSAITMDGDNRAVIDTDACISCGICAGACPVSAIKVIDPDRIVVFGMDCQGDAVLLQEGPGGN
jgi:ferredoxin